ncbi:organomercurial lyase [Streptomyces sp. NBC_00879]|uniref:organomercurial lyase n=1 Tax=Streptomyces sp. NBC_00879 TaxID=2975855 RepID=UPI00386F6A15
MARWEGRGARSWSYVAPARRREGNLRAADSSSHAQRLRPRWWDGAARSCTGSAADSACGALNFFTSRATARKWSTQHCEFTGNAVDQTRAQALGQAVFGRLLTESNHACPRETGHGDAPLARSARRRRDRGHSHRRSSRT